MLEGMQGLFVQPFFLLICFRSTGASLCKSSAVGIPVVAGRSPQALSGFGIDFMVEIDGVAENPVQVVCHVLAALPGSGGYPHPFFSGWK